MTALAGILIPVDSVLVAQTHSKCPSLNPCSTITLSSSVRPEWWYATPFIIVSFRISQRPTLVTERLWRIAKRAWSIFFRSLSSSCRFFFGLNGLSFLTIKNENELEPYLLFEIDCDSSVTISLISDLSHVKFWGMLAAILCASLSHRFLVFQNKITDFIFW